MTDQEFHKMKDEWSSRSEVYTEQRLPEIISLFDNFIKEKPDAELTMEVLTETHSLLCICFDIIRKEKSIKPTLPAQPQQE